jgi:hypothetical protein
MSKRPWLALSLGPLTALGQGQEPESAGGESRQREQADVCRLGFDDFVITEPAASHYSRPAVARRA